VLLSTVHNGVEAEPDGTIDAFLYDNIVETDTVDKTVCLSSMTIPLLSANIFRRILLMALFLEMPIISH
jgi:hypothetical protein